MTEPAFQTMGVEEYLRSEETSLMKREYVYGFVYPLHAQAGTTDAHDTIAVNILTALHGLARRAGGSVYSSDMRVATQDRHSYSYPDVTVTCEPRDPQARFKVAPCLLVEVLSKSTAHNDHNGKYHAYTALPSLHTYLIVEQTEPRVYAYQRTPEGWVMTPYGPGESVPLPCIEAELTLETVYGGMDFGT